MTNTRLNMPIIPEFRTESGSTQMRGLYKKFKDALGCRVRPCLCLSRRATMKRDKLADNTSRSCRFFDFYSHDDQNSLREEDFGLLN